MNPFKFSNRLENLYGFKLIVSKKITSDMFYKKNEILNLNNYIQTDNTGAAIKVELLEIICITVSTGVNFAPQETTHCVKFTVIPNTKGVKLYEKVFNIQYILNQEKNTFFEIYNNKIYLSARNESPDCICNIYIKKFPIIFNKIY